MRTGNQARSNVVGWVALFVALGGSVTLLLAWPASSQAANSCNFNEPEHAVTIVFDSAFEIGRASSGAQAPITLGGAACDGATVANTDTIQAAPVYGTPEVDVTIDLSSGLLAPGYTDESGQQPNEIEIELAHYHGYDELLLEGSPGNDSMLLGSAGIDLNPAGLFDDVDLSGAGGALDVQKYTVESGAGDDVVNAGGGGGLLGDLTGESVAANTRLAGGEGDDTLFGSNAGTDTYDVLVGGNGDDKLHGYAGDDLLEGDQDAAQGHGNDLLVGGAGHDRLSGGGGVDTVSYAQATGPVTVDLPLPGVEDSDDGGAEDEYADNVVGNVENLVGGTFDDTLIGSSAGNVLKGGLGADVLKGRAGNDRLRAKDGVRDETIHCGKGRADRATFDRESPRDPKPTSC